MKKRPAHPRHALSQESPADHMATCSDIRGHQQNVISSAGLSAGQKEKHIFLQRQRQRIAADWNIVPDAVITAFSVNCFRSCLAAQWMKQKYLQGFCRGKKNRNRNRAKIFLIHRESCGCLEQPLWCDCHVQHLLPTVYICWCPLEVP